MNLSEMTMPAVHNYDQIVERATARAKSGGKRRAAVLAPVIPDDLAAVQKAIEHDLVEPIIVGCEKTVIGLSAEGSFSLDSCSIIDEPETDTAVSRVAEMISAGDIDVVFNCSINTRILLAALFDKEVGFLPRRGTVSHVAVIKPVEYKKLLLLSDCAVVAQPDLSMKLSLIHNMAQVARRIGIETPRIAVLAAVEAVYPQMPVTMEGAIIAKMSERGQIKDAYVDGPLSFDVAVDIEAAYSKGVTNSQVAGQADGLLAPHIEVANGIYKGLGLFGRCELAGIIFGGKVPVAAPATADSVTSRFHSIALSVLTS
jgi:phosphate butyryltransferase